MPTMPFVLGSPGRPMRYVPSLEEFRAAAATVVRTVVSAMPLTEQKIAETA